MQIVKDISLKNSGVKSIVFDFIALTVIFLTPALSHMIGIPFYILEPMRLMLVLSILHTHRANAYFIAILLPLFSFVVSSHPVLMKSVLISAELVINVFIFLIVYKKIKNGAIAMFSGIVVSKIIYYAAKYSFLSFGLISGSLISTSLYFQGGVTILLSAYTFYIIDYKKKELK